MVTSHNSQVRGHRNAADVGEIRPSPDGVQATKSRQRPDKDICLRLWSTAQPNRRVQLMQKLATPLVRRTIAVGATALLALGLAATPSSATAKQDIRTQATGVSCGGTNGDGYNPEATTNRLTSAYEEGVGDDTNGTMRVRTGYHDGLGERVVYGAVWHMSPGDGVTLHWFNVGSPNEYLCGTADESWAIVNSDGDRATRAVRQAQDRCFEVIGYDQSSGKLDYAPNDHYVCS